MVSLVRFNRLQDQVEHRISETDQTSISPPNTIASTMVADGNSQATLQQADISNISDSSSIALELSNSSNSTVASESDMGAHFNRAYSPDDKAFIAEEATSSLDGSKKNESIWPTSDKEKQESPLSHFTVKWSNLDYIIESEWYKLSSSRKPILNSLGGCFKSGQLSAILGPSGAGKSTLVDCLVGKKRQGLSGSTEVIFHDGEVRDLKIVIIPQCDHLINLLTVTETLMFASKLKNSHLKNFDHFKNVQRIIEQLDLNTCSKQPCGKVSGGQYKRISIGQELLSNPDIIILDEPTSGLDAVTCYNTVSVLRDLIESSPHPMAIIATIHQPDTEVFRLFQHVYVLAAGGRTVYEGSVDGIEQQLMKAVKIIEKHHESVKDLRSKASLKDHNNTLMLEPTANQNELNLLKQSVGARFYNPAKLIVEVAACRYGFEVVNTMNALQLKEHKNNNNLGRQGTVYQQQVLSDSTLISNGKDQVKSMEAGEDEIAYLSQTYCEQPYYDYGSYNPKRKAHLEKRLCLDYANRQKDANYFKHIYYHCHRTWLTIIRDPMMFSLQVFLHATVPLLISYAFYGRQAEGCPKVGPLDIVDEAYSDRDMVADMHAELRTTLENLGYMFFQLYVILFAAVCVTSLTFPMSVHVLLKEYRNGWCDLSSYFIGRTLADLPVTTFNVVLAMFISYNLTGQADSEYSWRFLSVCGLLLLATLVAQTQGLMFGALLMNAVQSAVFVAPASTAPLVVVSGFLLRTKSMPWIMQMLSKISYLTYTLNGFIISRYGFNRCPCEPEYFELHNEHELPQSAKGVIDIWIDTFKQDYTNNTINPFNDSHNGTTAPIDLVDKLSKSLERAKAFGFNITSCDQMKPYPMLDYDLNDYNLVECFAILAIMLIIFRILAFIALSWMIRTSV